MKIGKSAEKTNRTNSVDAIVYSELRDLIMRGVYLRGARLPTEAELCTRYGLGRGAVRRAIANLREEGLVFTRQGSGAFVADRPETDQDAPRRVSNPVDLELLFEFRILLEREATALAAERRTAADIVALHDRVERLNQAIRHGDMGQHEDFDFHAEIARASGNPFLLSGVLALRTDILFGIQKNQATSIIGSHERLVLVEAEHAEILEAIEDADAVRASKAMEDHIRRSLERLKSGAV